QNDELKLRAGLVVQLKDLRAEYESILRSKKKSLRDLPKAGDDSQASGLQGGDTEQCLAESKRDISDLWLSRLRARALLLRRDATKRLGKSSWPLLNTGVIDEIDQVPHDPADDEEMEKQMLKECSKLEKEVSQQVLISLEREILKDQIAQLGEIIKELA